MEKRNYQLSLEDYRAPVSLPSLAFQELMEYISELPEREWLKVQGIEDFDAQIVLNTPAGSHKKGKVRHD